jgi:hypothetical protein
MQAGFEMIQRRLYYGANQGKAGTSWQLVGSVSSGQAGSLSLRRR